MKWFIYALSDPRDGRVRYIGKTTDPDTRYVGGHKHGGNGIGKQRVAWIKELNAMGLFPIMKIIETCTDRDADSREFYWMLYYARETGDLTNVHISPSGRYSVKVTASHRQGLQDFSEQYGISYTAALWLCIEYALDTNFDDILRRILENAK